MSIAEIENFLREQYKRRRDVAQRVIPDGYHLNSGIGRDTLLHPTTINETLALADAHCPQASDTIRVLVWQSVLHSVQSLNIASEIAETEDMKEQS